MKSWIPGFVLQVTRGMLGAQRMRRAVMFGLLGLAILMLAAGTTFLQETLDHTQHLWWFVFYWLACGWLTVTSFLLALFDLLIVRSEARAKLRHFRERLPRDPDKEHPD